METYLEDQPADVIEAIHEIAIGINAGETVVFCGAGISYNSGLPVVAQFIPSVLLALCGARKEVRLIQEELEGVEDAEARYDRLLHTIRELMGVSDEAIQKIITALPFEAFVEALAEERPIEKILDIYDADSYEPAAEPSTTHRFLAKLVASGKVTTIVTTNFDQLIEKALEREGKTEGKDYDLLYREEEFGMIDWAQDRTRLIKVHGSIHDKQAMAIMLRRVAQKNLSEGRADIIRHVYGRGKHKRVLVLGYSCSDVFDLSPQIEALSKNLKAVFLVQHSGGRGVEDIREQKDKNPYKGFENGKRIHFDTDRLVRALWDLTVHEPYAVTKGSANWNKKIDEWCADSIPVRSEATRVNIIGMLCFRIAEWPMAIRHYQHLFTISKEHNHEGVEVLALGNMGIAYMELGDYPKAIELHEKALEIAHRIGDARGEGNGLTNMGLAYFYLGDYPNAIELHEKALETRRGLGDLRDEGNSLTNMGIVYAHLGKYRKAIELHEKALEIARTIGDVQGEGNALSSIGSIYMQLGDYPKAIDLYEKALVIHRKIGDARDEGIDLGNMGIAYKDLGDYPKAIELHEKALQIARRIGDVRGEGNALANMGTVYTQLADYPKAIDLYEKALVIHRKIGDAQGEGNALGNIGSVYTQLGDYRKAIELHEKALEIAHRIGDVRCEGNALANMGLAYASVGDKEKATKCFEKGRAIFEGLGLHPLVEGIDDMAKSVGSLRDTEGVPDD